MTMTCASYTIDRNNADCTRLERQSGMIYDLQAAAVEGDGSDDLDTPLPLDSHVSLRPLRGHNLAGNPCILHWIIRSGDDSVSVWVPFAAARVYGSQAAAERAWLQQWLERWGWRRVQTAAAADSIEHTHAEGYDLEEWER